MVFFFFVSQEMELKKVLVLSELDIWLTEEGKANTIQNSTGISPKHRVQKKVCNY